MPPEGSLRPQLHSSTLSSTWCSTQPHAGWYRDTREEPRQQGEGYDRGSHSLERKVREGFLEEAIFAIQTLKGEFEVRATPWVGNKQEYLPGRGSSHEETQSAGS